MDLDQLRKNYTPTDTRVRTVASAPVAPKRRSGINGYLENVVRGIVKPFKEFVFEPTISAGKQLAAQVTGNREAEINARKNLFGGADDIGSALKNVGGNAAQVGLTLLAPGTTSIKKGALQGAGFGSASALADDGSAVDVLTGAARGGVFGGALSGVGKALSKVAGRPSVQPTVKNAATPELPIVRSKDVSIAASKAPNPLADASDADLMVRNYVDNLQFKQGEGAFLPKTGLSPQAKQGFMDKLTSKPAVANVADDLGLPKGYRMSDIGEVFDPAGKKLTIGQVQELTQPSALTAFEKARNAGDVVAQKRIAAANPGDARFSVVDDVVQPTTAASPVSAIDDVTQAAKLSQGENALQRSGNSLYRSTLGVDDIVAPNYMKPNTIFKADDLVDEAQRIGLRGTPRSMQRQVATQYESISKEVKNVLSRNKATAAVDGQGGLFEKALKDIGDDLPLRLDGVSAKSEIARTLGELKAAAVGNKITAQGIQEFKNKLGNRLSGAFKKLEKGQDLNLKEMVDMAFWQRADDAISALAPEAKALTMRQSRLYGLAQGLGRMTRTSGNPSSLSSAAVRLATPAVRQAENFMGRMLMKGGNVTGKVPIPTGAKAGFLGNLVSQTATRTYPEDSQDQMMVPDGADMAEQLGDVANQPMSELQSVDVPQEQYNPFAPENAQASIAKIISQGGSMKDVSEYLAVVKNIAALTPDTSGGGLDAAAKKGISQISAAERIVGQLNSLYENAGGGQGRIAGLAATGMGKVGLNDTVNAYNDIREGYVSRIVRALGEVGTLNEGDIQRAVKLIPRITDNPEEAKLKRESLEQVLSEYKQSLLLGQAPSVDVTSEDAALSTLGL